MTLDRDSVHFEMLGRAARLRAASSDDVDVAARLMEAAIKNERRARRLRQVERTRRSRLLSGKLLLRKFALRLAADSAGAVPLPRLANSSGRPSVTPHGQVSPIVSLENCGWYEVATARPAMTFGFLASKSEKVT